MDIKKITDLMRAQRDGEIWQSFWIDGVRQGVIAEYHNISESRVKKVIAAKKLELRIVAEGKYRVKRRVKK